MEGTRRRARPCVLVLATALIISAALADPPVTVTLATGGSVRGGLVSIRGGTLTLRVDGKQRSFAMAQVKRIAFVSAVAPKTPPAREPESPASPQPDKTPPKKPTVEALCKELLSRPPPEVLAYVREIAAGPRRAELRQAAERLAKEAESVDPDSEKAKAYYFALVSYRFWVPRQLTDGQRKTLRVFRRAHASDDDLQRFDAAIRKLWIQRGRRRGGRGRGATGGGAR